MMLVYIFNPMIQLLNIINQPINNIIQLTVIRILLIFLSSEAETLSALQVFKVPIVRSMRKHLPAFLRQLSAVTSRPSLTQAFVTRGAEGSVWTETR